MLKEIPNIAFKSGHIQDYGIEIITIESLRDRKIELDHDPEKAHQVAFNLVVLYTDGESKHLVDFVWHPVHKYTVMHISQGQVNAFKFKPDSKGYIILFTKEYLKKQLNKLPSNEIMRFYNSHLFSPRTVIPDTSTIKNYFSLFFNEFTSEKEGFNKKKIYNALYTIIFSKLEQLKQYQTVHIKNSKNLEVFIEFKNLVEKHYTKNRNATYYADLLHITYKHLNTICKEIAHITAKQFIDEFIILEAKRKLINSSIKSSELAFSIGFNEPTNFVKYFKKHTGLTPNLFKKSNFQ